MVVGREGVGSVRAVAKAECSGRFVQCLGDLFVVAATIGVDMFSGLHLDTADSAPYG
jgi:hypothetical protein